ncbi:WxL domain-containing protein [Listeria weihenstephanensis]|uniref:Cell surface protein n=1 Tax=Listeria weihenstephanensis TaxID=1006155 RepID=A0A1S7FY24_9LIST|nr:WxL domain-containing protein [Listeria weihenstephanensis]AQY52313.1 cell surface protein [Listeria weihenstephanensis]MBC1501332.1 WxL domain-containing protein [Listeria weihenstephanensis]
MKLLKVATLSTVMVASLSITGLTAFAADNDTSSDAKVLFQADDTGTTTPTDPTDPGKPVTPTDPVNPSTGPLRIDFASQINFGEQTISGAAKDYYALFTELQPIDDSGAPVGAKKYVPHYVQVTDNRGSNAGWNLTVSGTAFENSTGAELTGATLTLSDAKLSSSMAPTLTPGTVTPEVVVGTTPGILVSAEADKGMGTWVNSFGTVSGTSNTDTNKSVKLHVPAEAKKVAGETYTSTLTWTINDTP